MVGRIAVASGCARARWRSTRATSWSCAAIPRGSLEQIVFRVDTLHALAAVGVRAVNRALAIEQRSTSSSARRCSPPPACPRRGPSPASAPGMRSWRSTSSAPTSSSSPCSARWASGWHGSRTADVASGCSARSRSSVPSTTSRRRCPTTASTSARWSSVTAWSRAIERLGRAGGRTSRAARAPGPIALDEDRAALCVRAAAALGADYAGVDLLRAADGRDYVIEVNGIPGWRGRRGGDRRRRGGRARRAPGARRSAARRPRSCRRAARWRPGRRPLRRRPARARSAASRTPPPASSSTSGKRACSSPRSVDVGSLAGADPRRSSTIASRAPASAKRASASAAASAAQRRVGRDAAARRAGRGSARAARRAARPAAAGTPPRRAATRCRSRHARPPARGAATVSAVGGAGIDHDARLVRQRRHDVGFPGRPVIASRSAT